MLKFGFCLSASKKKENESGLAAKENADAFSFLARRRGKRWSVFRKGRKKYFNLFEKYFLLAKYKYLFNKEFNSKIFKLEYFVNKWTSSELETPT